MFEVLTAFMGHARHRPHHPAILDAGGCLTYSELADAIRRTAAGIDSLPDKVGLLAPEDRRGIIWYLALAWAGRTIVPLPGFFSTAQRAHIIHDAGLKTVIAAPEEADKVRMGACAIVTPGVGSALSATPSRENRCIIYTSGTTGRPKGVVLGERQLSASVTALIEAADASGDDRTLAVLPAALLLEQIAGIAVPLSVGASIMLCPDPHAIATAAATFAATTTVLVPDLLSAWVGVLERLKQRAPASLRFVAVGGAPVPPRLAERAEAVGLPIHEGYGLSECCAVVALNRPGDRAVGTVGRPISGVSVTIDRGEIVVAGATVMDGYHREPTGDASCDGTIPELPMASPPAVWRTGDAGHIDGNGRLVVAGRIDDVITTSTGRNIHPDWIEQMILRDPRIRRCAVIDGGSHPRAVLVPGAESLSHATAAEIEALVAALCADAPDYARPRANLMISETALVQQGLITANGRLRRWAIAATLTETP
ncbi:MAG: AMP-binding protein [Azospirillaceae bacterium]|nr:AMP-binding protein [Azospirillaceae bacterium]